MSFNMAEARTARIALGEGVEIEYRASYPHVEARATRQGTVLADWADLPPGEVMFHLHGPTPVGKWLLNTLRWNIIAYSQWSAAHQFHLMNDAVSLSEAARRLNLTPQALYAARRRHPDTFPVSCTRSANADLYRFREVENWYLAKRGN